MQTAKPEYLVPTYGVYVFDPELYDSRTVQIGGTLFTSDFDEYKTVLYVKCYNGYDDKTVCYVKIDIDNWSKVFITQSGDRAISENGVTTGIINAIKLPMNAPFEGFTPLTSEFQILFSTGIVAIKDAIISTLESNNISFSIVDSPSYNPTPFDMKL